MNAKLNYVRKNVSKEKTLIFLHGNSHSLNTFHNQLNSNEFSDYQIIAIDLPGHGESIGSDYSMEDITDSVSSFISSFGLNDFILIGHSFGGHMATQCLSKMNPKGLITFGAPPIPKPLTLEGSLQNPHVMPLMSPSASIEDLKNLAKELNYRDSDIDLFISDYNRTDIKFRTEVFKSLFEGKYSDEIELLKSNRNKVMTILPQNDTLINRNYIVDTFCSLEIPVKAIKGGHSPHIESPKEFNELVKEFAKNKFS